MERGRKSAHARVCLVVTEKIFRTSNIKMSENKIVFICLYVITNSREREIYEPIINILYLKQKCKKYDKIYVSQRDVFAEK